MTSRGERSLLRRSLIAAALLAALSVAGIAQAVHTGHGLVLDRSAHAARPALAAADPADAPLCALCLAIASTQAATAPPSGVAVDAPDAAAIPATEREALLALAPLRAPAEPRAPPLAH